MKVIIDRQKGFCIDKKVCALLKECDPRKEFADLEMIRRHPPLVQAVKELNELGDRKLLVVDIPGGFEDCWTLDECEGEGEYIDVDWGKVVFKMLPSLNNDTLFEWKEKMQSLLAVEKETNTSY